FDSGSVCIEFMSQTLPNSVIIWRSIIDIKPYFPSIRICYNCGRLGHIAKVCKSSKRCLNCSEMHDSVEGNCTNKKKCVNCSGPHSASDRSC
ncbi:hypothetical protein EAI_12577, partial [Harpegnathos saltator]